jgi:RNA polymerase sigma-70 factor, ECF subfamily
VVRDAWRSLSDGDRELLALVAWDGLDVSEIARVLRLPAPVVSARLYRARRRLAHRLSTLEARSAQKPCPTT